jgi:hypothetical protein
MSNAGASEEPITEFAKELAKQIPVKAVYQDVAAPAAQQTGQVLTDIVKTIQLALAPFQVLAAYQDRLRKFIDRSVRRVPKQKRITPAPQILGPIIEGIRYEPESTPIDEMFSRLLSSSMNADEVNDAHPAFPMLIKQLSSDEAKLIRTLVAGESEFVTRVVFLEDGYRTEVEVDRRPTANLTFPGNLDFYMEHLHHLGIARVLGGGGADYETDALGNKKQTAIRAVTTYELTAFGRRFAQACIE